MEYKFFKELERNKDEFLDKYSCSYIYKDSVFYIEPNFYTQLLYLENEFKGETFDKILNSILDISLRNKRVIFTGNFEDPLIVKDGFIYRDINDLLSENKIAFDIKINPESDWKD